MVTISIAKVSSTINSSYVLIENASFRSRLGNGGIHTLSASQVSILYCHGAYEGHLSVVRAIWGLVTDICPLPLPHNYQHPCRLLATILLAVVKPILASLGAIWV